MSPVTNKEALVSGMAFQAGLTKKQANDALSAFCDQVIEIVADGGKVSLIGFGSFESVDRAARIARNPQTGEEIAVPAKKAPKFSPGKAFKEACNH